jgi:hypothetical protein
VRRVRPLHALMVRLDRVRALLCEILLHLSLGI